jgi:hypothetical protein
MPYNDPREAAEAQRRYRESPLGQATYKAYAATPKRREKNKEHYKLWRLRRKLRRRLETPSPLSPSTISESVQT